MKRQNMAAPLANPVSKAGSALWNFPFWKFAEGGYPALDRGLRSARQVVLIRMMAMIVPAKITNRRLVVRPVCRTDAADVISFEISSIGRIAGSWQSVSVGGSSASLGGMGVLSVWRTGGGFRAWGA
ncbi:MAG TPA: hypothetical protein PK879_11675 [Opitutaceae bacterium]|nr:hypothetical protein [Opitutaceae bacterium]HOY53794.1 hypothetical protein [Opitutaceae bacterium]HPG18358.1 hypothetical protein [Opitutaceae bacterium]HPO01360.1 hypothetical protein [Opitutaceae bacterium]